MISHTVPSVVHVAPPSDFPVSYLAARDYYLVLVDLVPLQNTTVHPELAAWRISFQDKRGCHLTSRSIPSAVMRAR